MCAPGLPRSMPARRRCECDERLRPRQRAVLPASGGISSLFGIPPLDVRDTMHVAEDRLTLTEAAKRVGVTPATLRRWSREGLVPQHEGDGWSSAAIGGARTVARMRETRSFPSSIVTSGRVSSTASIWL